MIVKRCDVLVESLRGEKCCMCVLDFLTLFASSCKDVAE